MIIEFKDVVMDINFNIIKGDPPSDDRLYPGTPDTYELDYLYLSCQIADDDSARVDDIWHLLDSNYQQKMIELWLQAK